MTLLSAFAFFVLGVLSGANGLARWWARYVMKSPEATQAMLKTAYQNAHPHWLQALRTDDRRICPCCGWTEQQVRGSAGQQVSGPTDTEHAWESGSADERTSRQAEP